MSTTEIAIRTVYFNGTIGNVTDPLATIIHFSLLVHPSDHTVSGTIRISQGAGKETYHGQITGKTYAIDSNNFVRLISLNGTIPSSNKLTPLLFPFDAILSLKKDWNGIGGFYFLGKHKEEVPVNATIFNLQSASN